MATAVKTKATGINGTPFDFSGMKEPETFIKGGYNLQAMSTNGRNHVTSYLAKHKGKRVHGHYDYQKAEYIEEPTC